MPFTFTMPKLSPTMQEGSIAKWHKKEGDFVEAGELLIEIATDKATVEHVALDPGYIRKILKADGQKASVGEPLAILTEQKEESITNYKPEGILSSTANKQEPIKKVEDRPLAPLKTSLKETSTQKPTQPAHKTRDQERVFASPLAKTIASQQAIDLTTVQGTGPHGRIMSRDLANISSTEQKPSAVDSRKASSEEPLTIMRKVIGERLQYSKSTIPHFYIRQEVEVSALVAFREEVKKLQLNYTINDFIIKAVAVALRKHMGINSGFNPDTSSIIRYGNIDLAIAVTIAGGLITPILHSADTLPLAAISKEVKSLSLRAKEGKLRPEEFQGGSFTISNLGMYGVSDFQAIVNPPQAAILAVGAIQDRPIVRAGSLVAGKLISLTLSCDHRVIDGAEAASFMQELKRLIENPILFLSE